MRGLSLPYFVFRSFSVMSTAEQGSRISGMAAAACVRTGSETRSIALSVVEFDPSDESPHIVVSTLEASRTKHQPDLLLS